MEYAEDQSIEIEASLTYHGLDQSLSFGSLVGGPLWLAARQIDGESSIEPSASLACRAFELRNGEPLRASFRQWLRPGTYRVDVVTLSCPSHGSGSADLTASVVVRVLPD